MKRQPKLIGKIILANFLEYSVEKFITFVSDIERSLLYKKLVQRGVIMPKSLAGVLWQKDTATLAKAGVIARVEGTVNFSLYYTAREFSIECQISDEKLTSYLNSLKLAEEERENINCLLNKVRRINTRNLIVHRILEKIVEQQRGYFVSNNEFNLKPLSQAGLARLISDSKNGSHSLDFTIDTSRISRALRDLSIITPSEKEIPLRFLFVSRKDMVKMGIKAILNREKKDIGSGRIAKPRTDEELRHKIKEEYGLSVTRREVAYCRKELGILAYLERNGYVYHTLAANFSQVYPFTAPSVEDNAPASPGVYELCVDGGGIEYPTGCCQTFYIGRAKNLRKRLLSHLNSSGKNGGIKKVLKERPCVFRYLRVPQGWDQEEKKFYNLFVLTYGDSPQCNHMSPKVASKQTDRIIP
jgi:RNA polymerase sigma-54 factor